ncbi:MAG TPA: tripartite tricarboxylate transporter substrate binding protein [Vineibacter sp.]|nr:tripartite tricarboxylate transporter substrate binding protein [Vineibacter sp.]
MKIVQRAVLAALVLVGLGATASAQDYPNRPVRFIIPFTAGSSTDIVARALSERLSGALGQPVVVENKPGAGGRVGADFVAKSPADGYTILVNSSAHTVNAAIYTDLPFDTAKDFAAITALANLPNVLIIAPSKGIKTIAELVAYAKARPGQLNFASAGVGSGTHMNAEKFRARAGFTHTHVPFRGTPEAITEVMNGRVDVYFAPLNAALPFIKDGRVLALAVGTAQRSPLLPDVPTTIEAGVPASDYDFWVGMLAPAKTPAPIITRLHAETVKALQSPELAERLTSLGATPMPMTPEKFDAFIRAELAGNAEIVKDAGIKAN